MPFAKINIDCQYINKFKTLAADVLESAEIERFLNLVQRLPELSAAEVKQLTIVAKSGVLESAPAPKGIF